MQLTRSTRSVDGTFNRKDCSTFLLVLYLSSPRSTRCSTTSSYGALTQSVSVSSAHPSQPQSLSISYPSSQSHMAYSMLHALLGLPSLAAVSQISGYWHTWVSQALVGAHVSFMITSLSEFELTGQTASEWWAWELVGLAAALYVPLTSD